MDRESFAKALDRFLKLSGHFAGMTAWFDVSLGLDSRYLRRWRNEGKLPSVRDWNHLETKVKEEFKGNPEVLAALRHLREVWEYHHERVSRTRSAANRDEHGPEQVGSHTVSQSQHSPISRPEDLFARFIADTRIAAQLSSSSDRQRSTPFERLCCQPRVSGLSSPGMAAMMAILLTARTLARETTQSRPSWPG